MQNSFLVFSIGAHLFAGLAMGASTQTATSKFDRSVANGDKVWVLSRRVGRNSDSVGRSMQYILQKTTTGLFQTQYSWNSTGKNPEAGGRNALTEATDANMEADGTITGSGVTGQYPYIATTSCTGAMTCSFVSLASNMPGETVLDGGNYNLDTDNYNITGGGCLGTLTTLTNQSKSATETVSASMIRCKGVNQVNWTSGSSTYRVAGGRFGTCRQDFMLGCLSGSARQIPGTDRWVHHETTQDLGDGPKPISRYYLADTGRGTQETITKEQAASLLAAAGLPLE